MMVLRVIEILEMKWMIWPRAIFFIIVLFLDKIFV